MPTLTRTIAKGIPSRVRSPKTKKKSAPKHSSTKSALKKDKRKVDQSDNDSSDETSPESGDSNPKKRRAAKRQRTEEPTSDTEMVDDGELRPMVEEVKKNPDLNDEVSTKHCLTGMSDSRSGRGMGSMTINKVKTFMSNQQKRIRHLTYSQ